MDKRRLLLIVVCSFATAYTLHIVSNRLRLPTHESSTIDARVTIPASSVSPASRSLRPNYPYSVIPGGAYSPAELQSAAQRDALINSHYADFNLESRPSGHAHGRSLSVRFLSVEQPHLLDAQ